MHTWRTSAALGVALALALGTATPVLAQLSGSNSTGTTGSCAGGNDADGSCLFSVGTVTNSGSQFKPNTGNPNLPSAAMWLNSSSWSMASARAKPER